MRITLEQEDRELQSVFQEKAVSFQSLSARQKAEHIWEYHKWKFLTPLLLLLALVISFFLGFFEKEPSLSITLLNSVADFTSYEDFKAGYGEVMDVNLKENAISVDSLVSDTSTRQQIATKFFSGKADVILCDRDTFKLYYDNGCFSPLEEYIPKDYFETYPFESITFYNKEEKKEHIYGIELKDNSLLRKYFIEPPVFAICTKSKNKDMAGSYLKYLIQIQNDYTK